MSVLSEKLVLRCPYARARGYLSLALGQVAQFQEPETIRLRLPLAGDAGPALEKEVTVRYHQAVDPMHMDQPWSIRWTPTAGGPFPDFDGTLTVRADEDYTGSVLELAGTYQPPLGAAGAAFDAVLGRSIAAATAQQFLRTIGDQMEKQYRREEEAKQAL
ncbi:MAG: hypothetical protein JOZ38_02250 [Candidatus Eremiobacteraeota bacterium]|nr:hypothetical protein [Candidatus Eremiobacteraeota bacterium]